MMGGYKEWSAIFESKSILAKLFLTLIDISILCPRSLKNRSSHIEKWLHYLSYLREGSTHHMPLQVSLVGPVTFFQSLAFERLDQPQSLKGKTNWNL